ncbi:MAG: rubredoxin-type Fe(Cys)4 protein [Desulfobulbaceae bacterium]|nr:rubredoxin-type Fe(Cys)4 protein [Desulfobulbaceae bacterium]
MAAVEGTVVVKRWRCAVCGYVHTGNEPPEKCPVCDAPKQMFQEIDADGKALGELETEELDPAVSLALQKGQKGQKAPTSLFDKFANLSMKLHLHPITTHFPNGILPAVVVFLGLSVYFNIVSLETAAYYNLIFVLLMLPMVLLTGFIEWQKRYLGIKTAIFITKIICSLIVLGAVNVLVFWRLLDPEVMSEGSPSRLIYLGIAAGMLAAVGIAGHLGGKLVFGARG